MLTGGNHTWKHKEYAPYLESHVRALRPLNYPEAPGKGVGLYTTRDGRPYAVVNLIGRTFMEPAENPFRAVERALTEVGAHSRVIIVDMHAEASSEKRAMGWHLDGRVSVVWGTHTHVPTADEEILPNGTAYLGDIGMTGPYASVIGLEPSHAVKKFVTSRPTVLQSRRRQPAGPRSPRRHRRRHRQGAPHRAPRRSADPTRSGDDVLVALAALERRAFGRAHSRRRRCGRRRRRRRPARSAGARPTSTCTARTRPAHRPAASGSATRRRRSSASRPAGTASSPWTSFVTSRAKARCASRFSGAARTCPSSSTIAGSSRNVK